MIDHYKTAIGASFFAAVVAGSLAATPSYAAGTCQEQLKVVKEELAMPSEGRDRQGPDMQRAEKHLVAAETAIKGGKEVNCWQELSEASIAIIMESREHRNKGK